MMNFENLEGLFLFPMIPNTPTKHWFDSLGCMAPKMKDVVLQATKMVV
jgi:hypothetical protein